MNYSISKLKKKKKKSKVFKIKKEKKLKSLLIRFGFHFSIQHPVSPLKRHKPKSEQKPGLH